MDDDQNQNQQGNSYFSNKEYKERLFPPLQKEVQVTLQQDEKTKEFRLTYPQDDRIQEAYRQAADIRKFEIELFWKRATYYWAFILAAFTAHFALLGMLFSDCGQNFSVSKIYCLPGLSLFALAATALVCFFFSFAWTLVNKGSKFWQKNWEAHLDMLENEVAGKLYQTYLNTNSDEFDECPWSCKAYDYSVSKITMVTSIALSLISAFLTALYIGILIGKYWKIPFLEYSSFVRISLPIALLLLCCGIFTLIPEKVKGGNFDKTKNYDKRWHQREYEDLFSVSHQADTE